LLPAGALQVEGDRMKRYRTLLLIVILVALAVWIDLTPQIKIGSYQRDIRVRLGLDLVGGVQALLEADLPEGTAVTADSMSAATNIVENRVNGLGVEEALVQQAGDRRIVVEIPGVKDPEQAISVLKGTGLLEFVHMGSQQYAEGTLVTTDYAGETGTPAEPAPTPTVSAATSTAEEPGAPPTEVLHTVMTGDKISNVSVSTDELGQYVVDFTLNSEGTRIFGEYTSQNVGQILGIVLDKHVVSAPRVNSAITEGRGQISGDFTLDSANALAVTLRYGSLPIPLKIVETRTVGPTLGEDSLRKSLVAGGIGFAVVILFMGLYYRLPGLLADLAIIIYALIAFALFKYIPVTLTLPGIAGFLLSTGSALDANILIFERLKEELRNGRPLSQAIDLGWQRAWPSIRDSNIATIITCGILFWFGSSFGATIVKGFSLTLALGVIVSLFTAIVVTRTFLNLLLNSLKTALSGQLSLVRWFGI
jgi:preprotein translocase subunit SecD